MAVHGDDFTALGTPSSLDRYEEAMSKSFGIKLKGRLGHGRNDAKEVRVLNRVVRWNDYKGIEYEADPRHVEIMIGLLELENAKSAVAPGAKEEGRTKEEHGEDLDEEATHVYGALVARANYLAMDRPDISFSTKELYRCFASPNEAAVKALKRLVKYLIGRPRLVWHFPCQACSNTLTVPVDTDDASCLVTRRSTSGAWPNEGPIS